MSKRLPPEVVHINDRALVYDADTDSWAEGWYKIFSLRKNVTFFEGNPAPGSGQRIYSDGFSFRSYKGVQVQIHLGVIPSGPQLVVEFQTSNNGSFWYDTRGEKTDWWEITFNELFSQKTFCVQIPMIGEWIRMYAYIKDPVGKISFGASAILFS